MGAQHALWSRTRAWSAIAVAVSTIGASSIAARDLFDEIYARGQTIDATLRTITARFVETSTSSMLTQPVVARGTLAVSRPSRIILRYTHPEQRVVLINGNTLHLVWPSRGLDARQDITTAQRRIQRYFVGKSPQELRRHFSIGASLSRDLPGTWEVTMVPTNKRIKAGVAGINLWIDRDRLMLSRMSVTFTDGESKVMEFADVVVNPEVPAGAFAVP